MRQVVVFVVGQVTLSGDASGFVILERSVCSWRRHLGESRPLHDRSLAVLSICMSSHTACVLDIAIAHLSEEVWKLARRDMRYGPSQWSVAVVDELASHTKKCDTKRYFKVCTPFVIGRQDLVTRYSTR